MEKKRYSVEVLRKKPDMSFGMAVLRPKYNLRVSQEIASGLIFTSGRECVALNRRSIIFSAEYLRKVRDLDPAKRTNHIEQIASQIRNSKAVVYQKAY